MCQIKKIMLHKLFLHRRPEERSEEGSIKPWILHSALCAAFRTTAGSFGFASGRRLYCAPHATLRPMKYESLSFASLIKNWIGFILVFLFFPVFALEKDLKEKVTITADSGIYNYKTGLNIYSGHVRVDQGTSHITADKITTKNNAKQEITEVVAFGINEPAHYWTLPKEGDLEIHAQAKLIKFYPLKANIALEQNVEVQQGQNQFKGELIYYNSKDQTVTVPPAKNSQAVLIYTPET